MIFVLHQRTSRLPPPRALSRLLLSFFLLLSLQAAARAEGVDQVYTNPNPGREWSGRFGSVFRSGKSIAVIVAISQYTGGFRSLPSAQPDAKKMLDFLLNSEGYDKVYMLTDDKASKRRLEALMLDILPQMIAPTDRLLFYWSGHGDQWTNQNTHNSFGYLPLSDSPPGVYSSMVSMADIARWDGMLSARQTLFVIDACLSGLAGVGTKDDMKAATLAQLSQPAHFLITAGSANEQVIAGKRWQGSLFTDSFIAGAKGDAGPLKYADNVISLSDLMSYIRRRVSFEKQLANWSQTLTPQINKLQYGEGEYFFVPRTGADASAPIPKPQAVPMTDPKGPDLDLPPIGPKPVTAPGTYAALPPATETPRPKPLFDTISGTWIGTYAYARPDTRPPVDFVFSFNPSGCVGRSEEPNVAPSPYPEKLFANLACSTNSLRPGGDIVIRKTYIPGPYSHTVTYTGKVSNDLRSISGYWDMPNMPRGTFNMSR